MSRTEETTVAQGTNPNFLCSRFLSLSQCHSCLSVSHKAPGFHFQLSCSFLNFYIAAQPTNVWPCRLLTAELQCWGFISQRLELSSHVTCDFRETGNDACGYLMTDAQMFPFKNSLLKPLCFDNVVCQKVHLCVAFHVKIKRNTMLFYVLPCQNTSHLRIVACWLQEKKQISKYALSKWVECEWY